MKVETAVRVTFEGASEVKTLEDIIHHAVQNLEKNAAVNTTESLREKFLEVASDYRKLLELLREKVQIL